MRGSDRRMNFTVLENKKCTKRIYFRTLCFNLGSESWVMRKQRKMGWYPLKWNTGKEATNFKIRQHKK